MMRLLTVAMVLMSAGVVAHASALTATKLRCEYKADPQGIDVARPRLSWLLAASDPNVRGLKQTAYEILVASSKEKLDADQGDLWSSGKVASDETIQLAYAGKELASRAEAFWKVRVWSDDKEPSAWSEAAKWSMGLLDAREWQAKWIGYDEPDPTATKSAEPMTLGQLAWIWTDEGDATKDVPKGDRYFARKLDLPEGRAITRADFAIAGDDSFAVNVNGKRAGGGGGTQDATVLDISSLLHGGSNVLMVKVHNAGGPAALMGRLVLQVAGTAHPISIDVDSSWKFSKERPADWESEKLDPSGWLAAKEVAPLGTPPWGKPQVKTLELPPPPMLRKAFAVNKPVKRATVYATALGIYELHLNGQRVGKDYFTPGWTNYHKRVYYNTYDVTSQIKHGANAIGALLGDGWYCGYYAWGQKSKWYGTDPRLMVQLEVQYEDGSIDRIVTDESWRCAYGPWREGDLVMGTAYDSQREMRGWDAPGFDDSKWCSPTVGAATPPPVMSAYPGSPVRTHEELPAKSVKEPVPGVYVFDLGQNMVGWARFKLSGLSAGQTLRFRYTEMLNDDGTPYTVHLRGARVTDHYTAKGGGEESWEPIFTFHGFRYVEITGLKSKPAVDAVTGVVAGADMERTGTFESSSELANQLFHNIIWGQKGNYFEVPFDCPQRDERLGWTGDAQFFVPTAAYNFDIAPFFTKWLIDLDTDAQYPDGSFADVAPDLTGGHGNVAWGDAGVVCPYTIYKSYGDTRIIEQHYAEMVRYLDYLKKTSKDFIRGQGAYGDWVNLGGGAKSEVIGTAYFSYIARLMSEMASAIGKDDDAAKFKKLADDVRDAFVVSFVGEDGSIKESSQTGYALAFTMGLIPDARRKLAADQFIKELEKKNFHLATGFIGTPRLLPGLTMAGRNDVAYRLFLTDTFPSWLFQVKLGATTMWERWDGWTPDKGFQDPAMNSFNHYAFGSVGQWMYRQVAGIEPDAAGFKSITLRPQPGPGLDGAAAKLESIRGTIVSGWKRVENRMAMHFIVPPNTTATVYLPSADAAKITEGGKPIVDAKGVKFLFGEGDGSVYQLQSGTYEFSIPSR